MRLTLIVATLTMALLAGPMTFAAETVSCGLEEVTASQQMMCTPTVVYNEEGEVVGS